MNGFSVVRSPDFPSKSDVVWTVDGLFAARTVALFGGPAGVGKSSLVADLAVAVASGLPWLDRETLQGSVLWLDFDSDPGLQCPWFRRAAAGRGLVVETLPIAYLSPEDGGFLSDARLDALYTEAVATRPALIVIDAWVSALPQVKGNDASSVAAAMGIFRRIARDSGACVLLLDHTPKPVAGGPPVLERGVLGSVAKPAAARSVVLLQRVPRELAGDRDLLRLDVLKNNLAALDDATGIARTFVPGAVSFALAPLPADPTTAPGQARAARVAREILADAKADGMPRPALLLLMRTKAGCSRNTAADAVTAMHNAGEIVFYKVNGRTQGVRLADAPDTVGSVGSIDATADTQDLSSLETTQRGLGRSGPVGSIRLREPGDDDDEVPS